MKKLFVKSTLFAAVIGAAVAGAATGANAQVAGGYGYEYGYGPGYGGPTGWEGGYAVAPGGFGPRYRFETPAQHNACLQDHYQRPELLNFRC